MLVALTSLKGAPGVTSAALALAAMWPRPVVLLEADPAGGDIGFRCRAVSSDKGVLKLAARLRRSAPDAQSLVNQTHSLACGVDLVQGVARAGQARGVGGLWQRIADACVASERDVIADLGRYSSDSLVLPIARAADWLLPTASASMESVIHTAAGMGDVVTTATVGGRGPRLVPLLVGPDAHAVRDCADFDDLLGQYSVVCEGARSLPWDAKTLRRLQAGETASGRYRRSLLLRAAGRLAATLETTSASVEVSA